MPSPQTPHPVPQPLRDQLLVELTSRPLSGATSDQRYAVRRIAADAYALGFNDGRVTQQQFESIERDLAATPVKVGEQVHVQVHVWQTVRVVNAGPLIAAAEDREVKGYAAQLELRCACGTRVNLNGTDTTSPVTVLPLCPESPAQRVIDAAERMRR